ncbi:MAG: HNH endonuclease [Clostridiales bacterium]|nr:HNH endonuclease [Clostridiales bacterium]
MMTQRDNKGGKGYMLVTLNKPYGEKKDYRVHRLVAMAFIPNPENKQEINHLDGNTKNNLVENLEWCTHTENIQHAIETGLIKTFKGDIDEIIRLNQCEGYTGIQIADLMHTKETTLRGFIRKHGVGLKRVSRYGIDLNVLKEQFALGMTNKELAMKYHCSSNLIARRRYQMKRGMI